MPRVLAFEDVECAGDGDALGYPRSCGFGDVKHVGLEGVGGGRWGMGLGLRLGALAPTAWNFLPSLPERLSAGAP